MKQILSSIALVCLLFSNSTAETNSLELIVKNTTIKHSGRTRKSDGCHIDHSTGQEHCH